MEEIQAFRNYWSVGTEERTAFELFWNTAQRISDVWDMGRNDIRADGKLDLILYKNRNSHPVRVVIDLKKLPDLVEALTHIPADQERFVMNEYGRPFKSQASFGNWFRKACRDAGVTKPAHGIRKARNDYLNDMGVPPKQVMAIMGHASLRTNSIYITDLENENNADAALDALLKVEREKS
jgi:integrase